MVKMFEIFLKLSLTIENDCVLWYFSCVNKFSTISLSLYCSFWVCFCLMGYRDQTLMKPWLGISLSLNLRKRVESFTKILKMLFLDRFKLEKFENCISINCFSDLPTYLVICLPICISIYLSTYLFVSICFQTPMAFTKHQTSVVLK